MMEASKDALGGNSLLQRCDDLQKLCDTIRIERNYPKRTIDHVLTTDSFISSKRVRSEDKENTPKPIDESAPEFSPDVALKPSLDRVAFYKRLETYSTPFISKRRPVNAVQCAMHGFIDTHFVGGPKNNICKLLCTTCECTNFVIDISCFNPNIPKVQEIMQTYLKELSKSHRPGCFWKFDKCSDDIYSFPLDTSTEALDLIHTEGARLLSCEYLLPTIDHPLTIAQLEKLDAAIGAVEKYPTDNDDGTSILPVAKRIPYIVALFGWRLDIKNGLHALKCHHCFQTVKMEGVTSFNVVSNHMEYCPWVNRAQAMVQRPKQGQPHTDSADVNIGSNSENVCGYEWMIGIIDLEYDFLFYMRESSFSYQESRLQWFKDARRRMVESRAALAMEFPDSPDSVPDQVLETTTKESVEKLELEKVDSNDTSAPDQQQQPSVVTEDLPVVGEETLTVKPTEVPLHQENEFKDVDELESPTTVEPITTAQEETLDQEDEQSKASQEIEDELMDYMESEPEDEGEASADINKDGEVKDDNNQAETDDVDIDVSLLEDVQTPMTTGISTPIPYQLQQEEEVDDTVAVDVITPTTDKRASTLLPTKEIEKNDKTPSIIMDDDADEKPLDQQQEQFDDTVALTPTVQIEEIDDKLVDEEVEEAMEESSVVPIVTTKDEIEAVSSHQENEITAAIDVTVAPTVMNEDDNRDNLVHEEDEADEDSKFIRDMEQDEIEDSKDQQLESSPMIVVQEEKENEDMDGTDGDAVVFTGTPQNLTLNKDGEDELIAVVPSTEKEVVQEIQGTVSVSPQALEQDQSVDKDNQEKICSPVSDSLNMPEEEQSHVEEQFQQPATEKNNNNITLHQSDESTVTIQVIEEEEPTESQEDNNDNTSKPTITATTTTTTTFDEEETTTKEETVEQVDNDHVSETVFIDTTEKANGDDDHVNDEREVIGETTVTPEIVELFNDNKDGSDTPTISISNTDGDEKALSVAATIVDEIEAPEQSTPVENTDETPVESEPSENVETEAAKEEENTITSTPGPASEERSEKEHLKPLMDNIDTVSSSQTVSTPQLLQSMEDVLGQTPSSLPDAPTTSTTNDTQTTVEENIETSLPEADTTVATEEDTTVTMAEIMTTPTTTSIPKDTVYEDAMVEDKEERVTDITDEDNNQGGNGQVGGMGLNDEKTEDVMDAMEEDQSEMVEEIVDEEMGNSDEDKGEIMEDVATVAAD